MEKHVYWIFSTQQDKKNTGEVCLFSKLDAIVALNVDGIRWNISEKKYKILITFLTEIYKLFAVEFFLLCFSAP